MDETKAVNINHFHSNLDHVRAEMHASGTVVSPKSRNCFAIRPILWIRDRHFQPFKLYPILCCIVYWLNAIDPTNTFVADFKALLLKYPIVNPVLMGFPTSWGNEALWQ